LPNQTNLATIRVPNARENRERGNMTNIRRALLTFLLLSPFVAGAQHSDLENPGSVSAIQNRAYSMSFEFNPLVVGTMPLDAFYKSYFLAGAVSVHFTDYFAWQIARGGYSFNVTTGLRDQLERDFGVLPTQFDEINWFVGTNVILSPFYGKSAVLNTWVIHYEAYFLVGASLFRYSVGGLAPGINFGGGLRLFHTKYVSYRLEVTDDVVFTGISAGRIRLGQVISIQLMLALNFGGGE